MAKAGSFKEMMVPAIFITPHRCIPLGIAHPMEDTKSACMLHDFLNKGSEVIVLG
jgi:hypothetical protein